MPGRDSADAMQGFVDAFSLGFPQAVSEDGSLWARFGVAYQPAWVFVDYDGRSQVVPGAIPEHDLKKLLDQLIAA